MYDLTVVVPTYKRPELLKRCLESLYNGHDHKIQVIVVDDCMECSGIDVARHYPANYVAKKGVRKGLSRSRNIGMLLAEADYLTFLDDDDFLVQGGLSLLVQATKTGKDFVFFDYAVFDGKEYYAVSNRDTSVGSLLVGNTIPVGAYVIKRSSIRTPFDEKLSSHEDWSFILDNVAVEGMAYASASPVVIDKTNNLTASHQAATRHRWALDFLAVYARNSYPELASARLEMLRKFGIEVPEWLLSAAKYSP